MILGQHFANTLKFNLPYLQATTSRDDILLNIFYASSMLPHFTYMSTKQLSTKTSKSHPQSMIYSKTHLPLLEPLSSLLVSLSYEVIFFGPKQTPTSSCFVGLGFGVKTPAMQC